MRRQKYLNRDYARIDGEVKSVNEWIKIYGITRKQISTRLRLGWILEDAITKPMGTQKKTKAITTYQEPNR